MIKLLQIYFLIIITTSSIYAHNFEYNYYNPSDSSYNCSLIILPNQKEIKGLVVRDYSKLPKYEAKNTSHYKWRDLALDNGLAILYTVTSNYFPELYYDDSGLILLDNMINEAINNHNIPKQNIFIGGISSSGTRALKYAQYCERNKSKYGIKVNSVFSVDSPLDYERFYNSAKKHKKYFKDGMLWEANIMPGKFEEKFGKAPAYNDTLYRSRSVFSHLDSEGGNAKYLLNTSVIFFHEPDIDWWIRERGATFYDINSYDIAAISNHLKYLGHKDLELVTTTGKGFDKKGNRKCHSWTIVDENYLIDWILKRLK